ncbi:MAG TPA: PQQ-binding-like beta-propeller repeat protein, partial [Thermoanaerobaculia bacterium]
FYGDLVAAPGCIVALRAEGAPDGAGGFAGPHVVACFDPATGAERWRYESPDEWGTFRPLVADGSVVVGREGEVVALDAGDGSPRWRLAVPGLPRGLGRDAGRLFVGTLQGRVSGFPWPKAAPPAAPPRP